MKSLSGMPGVGPRRGIAAALFIVLGVLGLAPAGCGDAAGRSEARAVPATAAFGEVGRSPGQFVYPRVLENDGERLWVVDKLGRVQRLDARDGTPLAGWSMPRTEIGVPVGLTVWPKGPGGLMYVADTHYARVSVYRLEDASGGGGGGGGEGPRPVATFGTYGTGPGQFIYPTDIAILPRADGAGVERVYVGEYGGNDRISAFDAQHVFLFSFGGAGSGEDEFNRPQSIEIDPVRGELVVADACNHRIGVFTLEGELIRWIGSPRTAGAGPGRFSYPYGLALPGDGTALVCEYGNHRVQRVDLATGECLGVYGVAGREVGMLANPWAVTLMNRTVYILDSGNSRVQACRLDALARRGVHR